MFLLDFLGGWAVPLLLDISLVFVSISFLIMVYAGDILFATPLRLLAGIIPFVGSQIADGIGTITGGIKSWAANWAGDNVKGIVRLVSIGAQMIVAIAGTIVGAFEWVIAQLVATAFGIAQMGYQLTLNVAIIAAKLAEHTGLLGLLQTVVGDVQRSVDYIQNTFVPQFVRDAIGAAVNGVEQSIATVQHALENDIAAVDAGIRTDIQAVQDGIRTDIAAVKAGIETDIAAVVAGVETDIAAVVAGVETDIAGAIGDLEGTLETVLGVKGIIDVIALTALIFQKPTEAAQEVAGMAETWYHVADPLIEVFAGRTVVPGVGSIAWPELHRTPPAAPPPPHGQ